jgi:dipeptidyl aminopeptidase/acylaminoacyl peptidase
LAVASFEGPNLDVWRLDIQRKTLPRVTTHPGEDFSPVWSNDGRLALASEVGEEKDKPGPGLAWIAGNGALESLLHLPDEWECPSSWSPDGKWIAYLRTHRAHLSHDIMLFPVGGRQPVAFSEGPGNRYGAMFSPDGHWIAFVSDESKRPEVYAARFPGPGKRLQISTDGGLEPVWARNGRELFYRQGNKLMAVAFRDGSIESPSAPYPVFEGRYESTDNMGPQTPNYDVSRDGRFVMVRRKNPSTPTVIHVVLNWPEALRAPGARN